MISFISLKYKKIEKKKKKAGEGGAGAAALTDSGRKHFSGVSSAYLSVPAVVFGRDSRKK